MKTPMQELIEQLEEKVKEAEYYSDESRFGLYGALDIAKSILEKEKEVMCEFALKYAQADRKEPCETSTQLVFDETFNTKEK